MEGDKSPVAAHEVRSEGSPLPFEATSDEDTAPGSERSRGHVDRRVECPVSSVRCVPVRRPSGRSVRRVLFPKALVPGIFLREPFQMAKVVRLIV